MDIIFCSLFYMFFEFVKILVVFVSRVIFIVFVNILVNVYVLFTVYLNIKMFKLSMEKCL